MTGPLQDQSVLVIGRGGGLARAVSLAARDAGALVTAAGRDQAALDAAYAGHATAGTLARSLALELAPIRVNAISPGVIDTGAWDALGQLTLRISGQVRDEAP